MAEASLDSPKAVALTQEQAEELEKMLHNLAETSGLVVRTSHSLDGTYVEDGEEFNAVEAVFQSVEG